MIKISRLADYSIIIIQQLSQNNNNSINSRILSDTTGISHPTVMKLLKMLTKAKILKSNSGSRKKKLRKGKRCKNL